MTLEAAAAIAMEALAQSSHSGAWMTLPPTDSSASVPSSRNNSGIRYERQTYELPPKPFFIAKWYVGIILILLVGLVLYLLLALLVCWRFQCLAQYRARAVVGQSYVEQGYFDGRDTRRGRLGKALMSNQPPPPAFTGENAVGDGGRDDEEEEEEAEVGNVFCNDGGAALSLSSSTDEFDSESSWDYTDGAAISLNPLLRYAQ